jgi:putative intracellular protease/amidase
VLRNFAVLLFNGFETLDAFGPAEVAGKLTEIYSVACCSLAGGIVESAQNIKVLTIPISELPSFEVLLIPGGAGTRELTEDIYFLHALTEAAKSADYILTVCTGSALLAKTYLLDGKKATTNKRSFEWTASLNSKVDWQKSARWVSDGNIYSSSGISAGIDMTLGFIADRFGNPTAKALAEKLEYIWNSDKDKDPFAVK